MSDEKRKELEVLAQLVHERKIDRRRLIQAAAALGLTSAAAGVVSFDPRSAAAQGATKGIVTVSQEQQQTWTKNFNPFLNEGTSRWPTQAGIYEPMIIYSFGNGQIVPWLATEYAFNEDNTKLTFTLRDGVTWSDGQPLTAKDAAFTFNLFKQFPALQSQSSTNAAWGETGYLSDVSATDDKTVVFTFSRVYTPALYDLGQQCIVPEHIWKDVSDPVTFTNEEPVGTGPLTVISKFEAQVWQIEKNPTYWQEGKPYIQGLRMPSYPGNDQANLATINGENDWAGNFIPDIEKTFVSKDPEHYHYWFPATGATVHLYANTSRKPFDDVNVRKAISMAIDRAQIVKIAMYDYTHPADATGLSDAFAALKDQAAVDAGTWTTRDVAKANELLDAAGLTKDGDTRYLPDGTPMKYDINVVSGWSDWVSSCQIMAQNLKEIGIDATVKPYDFSAWFDRVQKGDFDLSIGWSSQGATVVNFFRGVMSSEVLKPVGELAAENWHRYSNPDADKLLADFVKTSNPDEQKSIAGQLQTLYSDNAPAIPLFPGPQWGESNTKRFEGFPDKDNPYSVLSTYQYPERLLIITTIKPVAS